MTLPVICGDPACARHGEVFNRIEGISPEEVETFAEGWAPEEDPCPLCGAPGVLLDPED